ncbi:ABC transporter ATP-binding protein [Micromonospora echinofusca]|uniref:ABC transporter ATP-binding protein n=1 Tax=Micromonospora echinofusca TaxID=47858 RepID=UPI003443E660
MTRHPLLDVRDLTVEYGRGRTAFRAVDGVSLSVAEGETVGLVGESGSGKSTIGRAVVGLATATAGSVTFDGEDITRATRRRRRQLSAALQMMFQDPYSSLNPARTVGDSLVEPLLARRDVEPRRRRELIEAALRRVGLPADTAQRYPAHFSGGQRQRIVLARALVGTPRLVICDEPVSALDVSVQAQVINLLADLQAELGLSYLFIAHDLAVVRHLSHRVVVLYRGQVMESGPAETVYSRPAHPYTRALIAAAPVPDPARARTGADSPVQPDQPAERSAPAGGPGCRFAARCPYVVDECTRRRPPLTQAGSGSQVACLRHREIADLARPKVASMAH